MGIQLARRRCVLRGRPGGDGDRQPRVAQRREAVRSYRAVVTAVDAARNVSRARTVTFEILRG